MKKKDYSRVKKNNDIIRELKNCILVKLSDIEVTCMTCPLQVEFRDVLGKFYYFRDRWDSYKLVSSTESFDACYGTSINNRVSTIVSRGKSRGFAESQYESDDDVTRNIIESISKVIKEDSGLTIKLI
jgi:hypothetical protein